LGSFRFNAFDVSSESDVENKDKIIQDLNYFLKHKSAGTNYISSFEQVEQEHLLEVRKIMHIFFGLFNLSLIFYLVSIWLLFYIDKKNIIKNLGISLFYGGIAAVSVVILFLLLSLNFDMLFFLFHKLFFQTQWQFPPDYLLIRLFPQEFFVNIFKRILVESLIGGLAVAGIGFFIKQKIFKQSSNKKSNK
jgi:integral membrane protein (TIGR01906 family)